MKALVLSGGGSKGAYQAGAIHRLGRAGVGYDAYCGISVGAINAGHMAMFKPGQENEAGEALVALWRDIRTNKVWKWRFGWYFAALWSSGLYNTSPLRRFLSQHFDEKRAKESGKLLRIGAVDLHLGSYRVWTEKHEGLVEAMMASSAHPIAFPAVQVDAGLFLDGGIRHVTPLGEAIRLGATEIDVIMLDPPGMASWVKKNPNTIDTSLRALGVMVNEITEADLKMAELYNRLVDAGAAPGKKKLRLRVLRPATSLTEDELSFDQESIASMMAKGYEDAGKFL